MSSRRRHERGSQSESRAAGPAGPAGATAASEPWAIAWSQADGLRTLTSLDAIKKAYGEEGSRLWIDLISPDAPLLAPLTKLLGLHPLVTEDILERNQRAKIEQTGDALHLVMFSLQYAGEVVPHELDIVLGPRYLLTSHDANIDLRGAPFMRREPGSYLSEGADFMLWSVTDWLVDEYFPVFDKLGDEIDELEVDVLRKPGTYVVERLFTLRRDLLEIRHAVNPQREIFNQLTNRDLAQVKPERIVYFRDVYDHLIRLTDELDSYRELVSTTLDIYLSQINNNLSEIMKRLTGVTVILATIGAIGGIFGMSEAGAAFNFTESWGFWVVTAAAIVIAIVFYVLLKRRGYI
ncbi:MAG TPA: magnesium transporter CorA family protein [Candidatus Limnocylindria bacterium]|nr:magnesium transporter CorA family protein [Candidatus Limnocylindria bacterium]